MRALFLAKIVFTFLMILNFSAVSISAEVIRVKNQADVENLAETVGKNPGSNPFIFLIYMMKLRTVFLFLIICGRVQNGMEIKLLKIVWASQKHLEIFKC